MEDRVFPTKQELSNTVLRVLNETDSSLTTLEINKKVAEFLELSDYVLQLEDQSGLGTEYDYRMRWVRTELKKRGLILNPNRGEWIAIK